MSLPSLSQLSLSVDWAAWRPRRSVIWWIVGAFLAGLALFAWVTAEQKAASQGPVLPPSNAARDYSPLPIPLPADARRKPPAMPMSDENVATLEPSQPVEVKPPPPRVAAKPRPADRPAASEASTAPEPTRTPAPRYPARALRNGDTGTVMVRAEIGADGVPTAVSVERGSGSRDLDRAAIEAVRRWRFRPATRGGQPTTGSVVVPIDFKQ